MLPADLPRLLLALGEIGVDLLAMAQVVADHGIDVRQGQGWESLRDLPSVRSPIEGMNDGVQRDPGAAHPNRAMLVSLQREGLDRQRNAHGWIIEEGRGRPA